MLFLPETCRGQHRPINWTLLLEKSRAAWMQVTYFAERRDPPGKEKPAGWCHAAIVGPGSCFRARPESSVKN